MLNMVASLPNDLLQQLSSIGHDEQVWLSGYLYGLATARHTHNQPAVAGHFVPQVAEMQAAPVPVRDTVRILYGSHTGNSKKVAQYGADLLRAQGWPVAVSDLNDYATKGLKEEKIVLLITSTQGEGDPPTAAEEFYKWLHGPRASKLPDLKFAVCGLGDKSYLNFCQTGKDFDKQFEALGATRLADRVDCDTDFESPTEQWWQRVATSLEALAPVAAPQPVSATAHVPNSNGFPITAPTSKTEPQYGRKNPFQAPILEKIQLNGRGSAKETWHVELSLEGSGLAYEPGDALGIYATNPDSLVREVLYAAMLNGQKRLIHNDKEDTFRNILTRDVELTVLTRDVVEQYANWTNNPKLKALLQDPAAFKQFLWGRNVADLLREYPAALSEATLLGFLRKMPPRLYSISSALSAHPDEVHLTVAAVRYQHDGRPHLGVASTFLADRAQIGDAVPVFLERNEYFKLPDNDAADLIMVGPGTGVAPFRSFVEDRTERGARGKNWLFFGNPNFETDFLYQTEWLNHLKRGTLDRLDVAFSRDQTDKVYVQHRLLERAKLLFERLENGAYFYVCGDKERMAPDVQTALKQIVAQESGKGAEYGEEYVKNLKKQRRYLEDVY
jgi:sulfite reductase (NADPH) flavoprotein alpha-component